MDNNLNLSNILLGKLTLIFPELEIDLRKQIKVRQDIEEILNNYNITSKCTSISVGDIKEKGELFLNCKIQEGCSINTIRWYTDMLNKLSLYFYKPCNSITTEELRQFLVSIKTDKRCTNTINSYITRLRVFFTWLQTENYILTNPAIKLKKAKIPRVIKKAYDKETMEKLRMACENIRDKALYETLESTACRIGELVNIKIKDISFNNQSIIVTGKGNKQREVYFSTRAKLFLEEYLQERKGTSEYLFLSLKKPYNPLGTRGVRFMLARLKNKANITDRIFPHNFRRTKATNLLNAGMPLQGVQQLLGHTSPATTEVYATLKQENVKNEYKRLTE